MNALYVIAFSTKLNILSHLKKTNLNAREQHTCHYTESTFPLDFLFNFSQTSPNEDF